MSGRPAPTVRLKKDRNPWSQSLQDGLVIKYLLAAALRGEQLIQYWIDAGDVHESAAFAQVFLDPTRPRGQGDTIEDRLLAVILYGDVEKAESFAPFALATADAVDRHGQPSRLLHGRANFLLGNGDRTNGEAVDYEGAISAGYGFGFMPYDRELSELTLTLAMKKIQAARQAWFDGMNAGPVNYGWYNPQNRPGEEYLIDTSGAGWVTSDR